jgi:TRAP transporter TAXI family solute receptor
MKGKILTTLAIFAIFWVFHISSGYSLAIAAEMSFPSELKASTAPMTTQTTIQLMAVAPEFEKVLNIKVRAIPADTLLANFLGVKNGICDFWNVHLGSAYRAIFGVEEYCTPDLGPQRVQFAYKGAPVRLSMICRGNSDIQSIADLKGKKVAIYAGGEGYISACLAFAGLTIDDVQKVPASGYVGALNMVLRNQAHSAFCAINDAKEIAASPGGVRYLPIPHDDKPGWKRLQKVYPALLPYKCPEGIGLKEAWGVEMLGFPFGLFVLAGEEPSTSYAISKVYNEGYEAFKDKHNELKFWKLEEAVSCLAAPTPYHAGSVQYFKEKGLWTKKHEEWQQNQLRLENARQEAWQNALKEAKEKGIKTKIENTEWQQLWRSYLNKIE